MFAKNNLNNSIIKPKYIHLLTTGSDQVTKMSLTSAEKKYGFKWLDGVVRLDFG